MQNYNYSQNGWYFVTICTQNYYNFFGEILNNKIILNKYGQIVNNSWFDLPNHYKNCILDEFIVMPNHIHGIVIIKNNNSIENNITGLSEIIRGFKTFSSREINKQKQNIMFHWQKSFYDHIIRNEKSLNKIREYIINNPLKWESDRNNFKNL
ncbi:MAG: transposase [Candidatus Kuenenbacteria bacterium]